MLKQQLSRHLTCFGYTYSTWIPTASSEYSKSDVINLQTIKLCFNSNILSKEANQFKITSSMHEIHITQTLQRKQIEVVK